MLHHTKNHDNPVRHLEDMPKSISALFVENNMHEKNKYEWKMREQTIMHSNHPHTDCIACPHAAL
jgi:hypothetical protein